MVMTGISPVDHRCEVVRHLAHRRLEPAVEGLRLASDADLDEVVHDVRKRCKRVRALLRLVRADLGEDVYHQENRALRDAARALAPVRDAAVLIQVHDDLVEEGAVPVGRFRTELVERHRELRHQVLNGDTLPRLRESIAAAMARIDTWPLETIEWETLGPGVKRVYGRGRKAMAAAYDDPTTERFHQWRKRAQYLRHQLGFLKELWPEVIGGSTKSAHALTDVLGDAHDLAVLGQAVDAARTDARRDGGSLSELIASRRALLRARAEPIGLRLYAEKPSRFIARLGRYWNAGNHPAL
ncbi:MAG TPA: CHAD domain-containing protein [Candidatus Sulfotelmatobacter sp.]|nr:CHAD domain-containing protein [Candidatus Sulfotelmatobacter sp.]